MKIYIESNLVDIKILKELKSKFNVVYKDDCDVDIKVKGDTIIYNQENIDLNELLETNETKEKCLNSLATIDKYIETLKQSLSFTNASEIKNFIKDLEVARMVYNLLLIKNY